MQKAISFTSILLLILAGISAQNVEAQTQATDIDSLNATKEIADLKHRIEIRGIEPLVIYKLAADYSLSGQPDSSLHYLNMACDDGSIIIGALDDPDFENVRNHARWDDCEKRISDTWHEYYPDGNLDFTLDLMSMETDDQLVRADQRSTSRKYGHDSKEALEALGAVALSDSLNSVELDSLIQKYGWPKQYQVGQAQLNAVVTVLLHSPLRYQKKYLPDVQKSVEEGELANEALVYLQAKIEGAEGVKKQE